MLRPPYGRKYPARSYLKRTKSKRRRPFIVDMLFAILILAGFALIISWLPQTSSPSYEWSGRPTIIDGDTIILDNQRLRLKGIDAPEIKQNCLIATKNIACGLDAKHALQQKIAQQTIHCLGHARDKYKRFLAVCYLGQTDINQWLVEEGHAVSYYDYPSQERDARLKNIGIWAGQFERPQDWRQSNNNAAAETATQHTNNSNYLSFAYISHILQNIYDRIFNIGGSDE